MEETKVKLTPVLDNDGNPETLGEIMVVQATDANTGKDLGIIARLGLDGLLAETLDQHSELREKFVKCSDELSSIIAEIFALLPEPTDK